MKVGQIVNCPADRGDAPYTGTITWVGAYTSKNMHGVPYVWLNIKGPGGRTSVWPSNRLGFKVEDAS